MRETRRNLFQHGSIDRERLNHLLAFIDARPWAWLPVNVLLESFVQTKELAKKAGLWPKKEMTAGSEQLPPQREYRVLAEQALYSKWAVEFSLRPGDVWLQKSMSDTFGYRPLISILLPTYNTPANLLREAIDSVLAQTWPHWELCIADDASTQPETVALLKEYEKQDPRIKVLFRRVNGHISEASNSALEMATGDFVALLDHDDVLTADALFHNVLALNHDRTIDMLYSDEDKIDVQGNRRDPFFKPDWSPETFLSRMFTCHLGVYRRSLVQQVGGFRSEYNGAQDWDLVLRLTERTHRIVHIPRILYHWRMHEGSTASSASAKPYADTAGKRALEAAGQRRGYPETRVEPIEGWPGSYRLRPGLAHHPRVSIVIPTRDHADVLKTCIESIFSKTTHPNYEVLVVDNGSREKATFELFRKWQKARPGQFQVVTRNIPFNFSTLCNDGVAASSGELIVLLNNDTEVVTDSWLERMAEWAVQEDIGAVGAKLLYPNDTVQHAGVVVGIGGVAANVLQGIDQRSPGYFGNALCMTNFLAVTAACLMVSRKKYDKVQGLEPTFAVAFNDVDFCLKLFDAGFRNLMVPDVVLYHYESRSRGSDTHPEKRERFLKESKLLRARWSEKLHRDPYYSPHLTLDEGLFQIQSTDSLHARPTWSPRALALDAFILKTLQNQKVTKTPMKSVSHATDR